MPNASPSRRLEGKVALVTGAARGIGRAVATKLASEGARVVINDRDAAPIEETAKQLRGAGAEVMTCAGSVTDAGFAERFVGMAIDSYGALDIIVNNAGYTWDNVIQKMTDEQFRAILDVHLVAPFQILRAASEPIRRFAKQEAAEQREVFRKVVNISSVVGLGGNPGQANYASAKAGVIGLTKTLAKEWGRYKVNVNCVAFGFIKTAMTQPVALEEGRKVGVQPELLEKLEREIPLGRLGTPEEAADAVYLFCGPESNYISGQVITVGGGMNW
ncbi:MAG: SDR family NAD(P)-dependent oxidoreductase [Gemmatimonadaceae bacterium]